MKLVISSLLLALLATGSVSAQTTQAPAGVEAAPAQEQMAAPAETVPHEKKHKKAHKAAAHHVKKKHHKKKKHQAN